MARVNGAETVKSHFLSGAQIKSSSHTPAWLLRSLNALLRAACPSRRPGWDQGHPVLGNHLPVAPWTTTLKKRKARSRRKAEAGHWNQPFFKLKKVFIYVNACVNLKSYVEGAIYPSMHAPKIRTDGRQTALDVQPAFFRRPPPGENRCSSQDRLCDGDRQA